MDRISDELPNLRAALTLLRDADAAVDHAAYARLVFALGEYWLQAALAREGLEWLTSALSVGIPVPSRQRAEMLALAGDLAMIVDRYDEGFALIEESLACSAAADEAPAPMALLALGLAALVQNRSEDARRFSDEAIEVARASGDPYQLGNVLVYVSATIGMGGDDARGVVLADEGVAIARALGNANLLAAATSSAGVARSRIAPGASIDLLEQSFALPGNHRARHHVGHTWKAVAHLNLKEYSAAASELCIALPLQQERGEPYQQSLVLVIAASVLSRPQPEVAVRLLAVMDQQRDDGRFVGAAGDLAVQAHLRDRLEARLEPAHFATLWSEGRAMNLDDATALALDHLALIADSQ